MKNLVSEIQSIADVELKISCELSRYTTIRLKSKGDVLIVKSINGLKRALEVLIKYQRIYHIVGWGANQVLHNTDGVFFIKLQFEFDRSYLEISHDEYHLPASVSLNILTSHAKKFGLVGWEVFTGIPASLGGAVFMNAGTNLGEIKDIVKSVTVLRSNLKIDEVIINKDSFKYRGNNFVNDGDIILFVTLFHHGLDESLSHKIEEYLSLRKRTQPLQSYNCGCVFKNFDSDHKAGQYIDVLGLKGLKIGDLKVSDMHANFIENSGSAKSIDFVELTDEIKYQLELFSGIQFELEAKVY
jgi:UDP-N-acetylmuramate dehydrogenase